MASELTPAQERDEQIRQLEVDIARVKAWMWTAPGCLVHRLVPVSRVKIVRGLCSDVRILARLQRELEQLKQGMK